LDDTTSESKTIILREYIRVLKLYRSVALRLHKKFKFLNFCLHYIVFAILMFMVSVTMQDAYIGKSAYNVELFVNKSYGTNS